MFQDVLPGMAAHSITSHYRRHDDTLKGTISPQLFSFAISQWLDAENRARILISSDMTVRWASHSAQVLVESGIIRVHDGRLIPRSTAVVNLLDTCTLDEHRCAISIDCQQMAWVVWARRLCDMPMPLIGITFQPPRQSADYSALVSTNTLTPTEGRVVEMLLNGFETGRIAQALNISTQTLKTHIKHVYCKLGVKSRGDLFAQAAGFATP